MKNWLSELTLFLALGGVQESQSFVAASECHIRQKKRNVEKFNLHARPTKSKSSGISRRSLIHSVVLPALILPATTFALPNEASARLESVNRPDLLPSEKGLNVIQTEKYLTSGQTRRLNDMLASLEKDTGFRVKVLCQNYPNTPGLAIRDYWSVGKEDQKDDNYVVLVVDQFGGRSNSLNFNVGDVRKTVPCRIERSMLYPYKMSHFPSIFCDVD
jgi:hypothetical protein